MLELSEEQMLRADEKYRIRFHKRIRTYVREKIPDKTRTIPDSQLLAYIVRQDKIAEKHEITTERGVAKWVCYSLGYGEDFYQEPEIKTYFNEPEPPNAEDKLSILIDYMKALKTDPNVKIESIYANYGYPIIGGK